MAGRQMADRSTKARAASSESPVIRVDEWNNWPIDGMKSTNREGHSQFRKISFDESNHFPATSCHA
jgi:hypothetical protein